MEERMTVCNMSIEARRARRHDRARRRRPSHTSRAGRARRRARPGTRRSRAGGSCRPTRARASTARSTLDAAALEPMITYGTNPGMGIPITGAVPDRAAATPTRALEGAARTWASTPASRCSGSKVDVVFIGSCTNSRLSRSARRGERAARAARSPTACACWSCPGSQADQEARPRPKGSTGSSSTPAPSGARPAARCASP